MCALCVLSLNKLFALCLKFVCEMKNLVFSCQIKKHCRTADRPKTHIKKKFDRLTHILSK